MQGMVSWKENSFYDAILVRDSLVNKLSLLFDRKLLVICLFCLWIMTEEVA